MTTKQKIQVAVFGLLLVLACVASFTPMSVSAQADQTTSTCFTVAATREAKYTVPTGYVAWPGNGMSYPAGVAVWGPAIRVCPDDTAESGGDEFDTVTSEASTGDRATNSGWNITWYPAADFNRGDGTTFRQDASQYLWRPVAPQLWRTFPNVPNTAVPEFPVKFVDGKPTVPWGLEYGMDESNFCQQNAGESCRVPVAAQSYFLYTGDYNQPGVGECHGSLNQGCILMIVNVGRITADYTGVYQQGFEVKGRYWHGGIQQLPMAVWGAISHASANMTNQLTTLNTPGGTNAGSNCSVVDACNSLNILVHYTSGNEPLMQGKSGYSR